MNHPVLPFRSLFMHGWELVGSELEPTLEWMAQAGLNTLCVAATYHHGWFLQPHHPKHRAFMTEGDVCYFHPHAAYYKNTPLRPKVAQLAASVDLFAEAGKRLDGRFNLVAWTIGTHHTTFGLAHPHLTVTNVYGDHLPHALCFNHPEVREYLKGLCGDLAHHYPLWGIQLEAFGWMPFDHGHHHERDLVGLTALERELMGTCFCPACEKLATIDLAEMQTVVKGILDTAFREAPDRPANHPRSIAELVGRHPAFQKFQDWRKSCVNNLIKEIKRDALAGTQCRLLLQTDFDLELAGVADGFACVSYGQTPAQTEQICRAGRQTIPSGWNSLYQCLVQLGLGVPRSEEELAGIIAAAARNGCNGINFYNHSEAPPKMLQWLARTLPEFAE